MTLLKLAPVLSLLLTLFSPEPITQNATPKRTIRWSIEKSSTLKVSGKSNINEFSCEVPGYYETDTLCLTDEENGREVKLNGCLEIEIFKFDCNNNIITNDLRKTLKSAKYPKLQIHFLSLQKSPSLQYTSQTIKGNVEVCLAGVRRNFTLDYLFLRNSSNSFFLNGNRSFCFSDFNLTPPRKLGGMIQVKDEFNVNFRLKLNMIN